MTTDLTMLIWSVLLTLVSPYTYVTGLLIAPGGLAWGVGNRDQALAGEAVWARRARRAHANLVENMVPFAALVLAAHVAGRSNAMTALGAQLFFWARLLYLPAYVIGLVPWRTLIFGVATLGQFLILLQLLLH
jgi:uncharacterized MAPEG superfamily protein